MIILPLLIGLLIIFGLCSIFISNLGEITAMHQKDCRLWSYDAQGVPYYNYSQAGLQRNPLYVASEVINHFRDYKNGAADALQQLTSNANWLVSNASPHGDYSLLEYNFPLPRYKLEPPWHSAAAQARAIEGLAIANAITGNKTYLETAKSLLNSFFVEVKDGGVTHKTPHDGWWYEDFASESVNASRALDGMMLSLLSIFNYYKYTNDADAKFLFDQGVLALKKNLQSYDDNGYSYYDIHKTPAPSNYHTYHVDLLRKLLLFEDDEILRKYYDKWSNYKIADRQTLTEDPVNQDEVE